MKRTELAKITVNIGYGYELECCKSKDEYKDGSIHYFLTVDLNKDGDNCVSDCFEIKNIKNDTEFLTNNDIFNFTIDEICPNCNTLVELPNRMGIYKCPECGELMISCSICENQNCSDCEFDRRKR